MAKNKSWSVFWMALLLVVFLPCLNTNTFGNDTQAGKAADAAVSSPADIFTEALAAFIKEVDNTYPFFVLKGIGQDWQACKEELIQKVEHCKTNNDFYVLLDEAKRRLRDPHMRFSDLKGEHPRSEIRYYPGVSFLPAVDDRVAIMSCADEYVDKLPVGSIVTEIDGRDAREFIDEQAEKSWKAGGYFSSPQRACLYVYRIPLQGKENDTHQIAIIKDGKPDTVTVTSKWQATGWPHTYAMPKDLKRLGDCLYGKLSSGYGYIYLRRIRADLVKSIDAALASFEGIRGLIIDLRGNGGGGYSGEVFKRFDKKKGASLGIPFYRGDMVVLIDAGTISAGETFARDLVYYAEAYLMGSRTAGSSSAKRAWRLPHDLGTVTLSRRSRWGFEGEPIEYNGIAPHEAIEVVPAELQSGTNSGIKRAEEYLDKKWAQRAAALANSLLTLPGTEEGTKGAKAIFSVGDSSLSGVVRDESGQPVEKVKISNWSPYGTSPQVTYTDEQGKFRFKRHRGYAVLAEKDGFAPMFCEFREEYNSRRRGFTTEIIMVLSEGCTVDGTVFSEKEKKPMAGVKVDIERWGEDAAVGGSKYAIWTKHTTTDSNGYFRFEKFPSGAVQLRAQIDDKRFAETIEGDFYLENRGKESVNLYLRLKTPEELQKEKELEELSRDLSLSGTVTDEYGKGLGDVKISNWFPHSSNPQITLTDNQGKFRFEKHYGYVISAQKEGFAPFFFEFKDEYNKKYSVRGHWRGPIKGIKIILTKGGTVEGRILSKDKNKPISDASVVVERWAKDTDVGVNRYIIWTSEAVKTDQRGHFRVDKVPAGIIRVRAGAARFREGISDDFKLEAKGSKVIEIYLSR